MKQRRENRNLQKQQIIFQLKPLVSFSIRNFFHDHQWIFYQTKKLYSTNEKKKFNARNYFEEEKKQIMMIERDENKYL